MKKLFHAWLISVLLISFSCKDDKVDEYKTYPLNIELVYPATNNYQPVAGIVVSLTDATSNQRIEAKTDDKGVAQFTVAAGVYDAAATDNRQGDGVAYVLNGTKAGITITESWSGTENIKMELVESQLSQVIIKELNYGGTPKDDGSGSFNYDKYVILYNNSTLPASLDNVCLAITFPYGPKGSFNKDYINDKLFYEAENWVPAGQAFWYFKQPVTLEPYSKLVIALSNAIDNTKTYSKSINFANPDYYCTYDIDVFNHKLTYPAPSEVIPTSHYLKAVAYGAGTAWAVAIQGPGFFLFSPKGQTKEAFAENAENIDVYGGFAALKRKKVPVEWVLDGVEVFNSDWDDNKKRLNTVIDAGYVFGTMKKGYTIYRNVDKDATEAIKENEGKLVYNYTYGTAELEKGSTDPSGIDAEASIKNGAKIVYMNTNNSTTDFHQRKEASLRFNP